LIWSTRHAERWACFAVDVDLDLRVAQLQIERHVAQFRQVAQPLQMTGRDFDQLLKIGP
jgi:hypothetical protein